MKNKNALAADPAKAFWLFNVRFTEQWKNEPII